MKDNLIKAIETTLGYFYDEFPKGVAWHDMVWEAAISPHAQGITPLQLEEILKILKGSNGMELSLKDNQSSKYIHQQLISKNLP